jgi:cytoskeletal protein RodZ
MPSLKTKSKLRNETMTKFYRINLVAVLVSVSVICAGCKRTDDLSHPSSQQAASANKKSDTSSANKPAAQPSASSAPAKSSDDQKDEAKQAPAAPKAKAEATAKETTAAKKLKTTADKAQTASTEKKTADNQPSTKPAKSGVVVVPQTAHVRVDIPKGLQKLLNDDSRMQPWVDTVMKVADSCYATQRESSEKAEGVIVVDVTMHPNARPDAEIKSLPPQLSGMVACATGGLMRTHMPLFTGPEGEQHTVRIHFKR